MKNSRVLLWAAVVLFSGCLTDSGLELSEPKPVSAAAIRSANPTGRVISIVVNCVVPQPCWGFTRTNYNKSRNSYAVTVYASRITNDPCADVLSSIDAPFSVTVGAAGSYSFRFWQYGGTTLDTTIVVQ